MKRNTDQAGARSPEKPLQHALSGPYANIQALQRTAGNSAVGQMLSPSIGRIPSKTDEVPRTVYEVLRSPGQPLTPAIQYKMGSRLGYKFDQVRVHTDETAAQSASDLGAEACTAGRNLIFGAGRYIPETEEGAKLLAHELVHVVQQAEGRVTSQIGIGDRKTLVASLEQEAEHFSSPLTSSPINNDVLPGRFDNLPNTKGLHPSGRPSAIQLKRRRETTAATKPEEVVLSAHLDPSDPNVVVFNRPVTVEQAKKHLWTKPPSDPGIIKPEPKIPFERRHTRFRLRFKSSDEAWSMLHGLGWEYQQRRQRFFAAKRSQRRPLEDQLEEDSTLPATAKSIILRMSKGGQFTMNMPPQVHRFKGPSPYGTVLVWIGPDDWGYPKIEKFQFYPEGMEFYHRLGFDKYQARILCNAMKAINAKMNSYVEGTKKMCPSDAYEKIREESLKDLRAIALRELPEGKGAEVAVFLGELGVAGSIIAAILSRGRGGLVTSGLTGRRGRVTPAARQLTRRPPRPQTTKRAPPRVLPSPEGEQITPQSLQGQLRELQKGAFIPHPKYPKGMPIKSEKATETTRTQNVQKQLKELQEGKKPAFIPHPEYPEGMPIESGKGTKPPKGPRARPPLEPPLETLKHAGPERKLKPEEVRAGAEKAPGHELSWEQRRGGRTVTEGHEKSGTEGSGRVPMGREQVQVHTEGKVIQRARTHGRPGDTFYMDGVRVPCGPLCQPALRNAAIELRITFVYRAAGETWTFFPSGRVTVRYRGRTQVMFE